MLDVDGVLNSNSSKAYSPDGFIGIPDKYVKRLKKIVDATGAKVVLSSDWKMASQKDYHYLTNKLWFKGGISIYSQTPNIRRAMRGTEIREWLKEHDDVEAFVVLDDEFFSDYITYESNKIDIAEHLIWTDPDKGLTEDDVRVAIEILNEGI